MGGIGIKLPGIWGGVGAFAVAGADDAQKDQDVALAALKAAGFALNTSSGLYEMPAGSEAGEAPVPQGVSRA
jgi:hypothetical protein